MTICFGNIMDRKYQQRSRSHGRHQNMNYHSLTLVAYPLLQKMIAYINNTPLGCILLKDLWGVFKQYTIHHLWSFICDNPSNFQIQKQDTDNGSSKSPSGNEVIWIKTDLRLCEMHCRKGKNCRGECGELHLCRTFLLLGDRCCPFEKSGKKCAFGHNFHTDHNSRLLNEHKLSHLSGDDLRALLRRRICRSVSTMPQICLYYNGKGKKGCSNKNCRSLHLCLDFVLERCNNRTCKKNHSMSAEQVAYTLDLFAIDQSWPNEMVLQDLRSIMKKRIRHDSDVTSVGSAGSYHQDDADEDDEDDCDDSYENGYAVGGAERSRASQKVMGCCSHCHEMRTEMIKMKEKMQELEAKLDSLKETTGQIQSIEDQELEEVDILSPDEKKKLSQQLLPIVKKMQPKLAEHITGMILDMEKPKLLQLLTSQSDLELKIEEAAELLSKFMIK